MLDILAASLLRRHSGLDQDIPAHHGLVFCYLYRILHDRTLDYSAMKLPPHERELSHNWPKPPAMLIRIRSAPKCDWGLSPPVDSTA